MNRLFSRPSLLAIGLATLCSLSISAVASAAAAPTTVPSTATQTAADSQRTQTIITKGDQEINRRLTSLGTLTTKVSGTSKLTISDKATLTAEVSTEVNGLNALKTKLDGDTTLADARADAQSIYTDYRVYALVVPKIGLIKTADDQQVVEAKLTALAPKLQARLTSDKTAGKDTTSLQSQLDDLNAKVTAAQAISSSIETKVIGLQPTDYNSDHTLLSGDAAQLKTAHTDNQGALTDAKAIVTSLKTF